MNRRNLLKSLCCAVAVSAMEVCGLKAEMPRVLRLVPNPAYAAAEYEVEYHYHPKFLKRIRALGEEARPANPPRYNFVNGEWVKVEPFVWQEE